MIQNVAIVKLRVIRVHVAVLFILCKLSKLEEIKEESMSSLDGYSSFKSVSFRGPKQQMFPMLSTFKIYYPIHFDK